MSDDPWARLGGVSPGALVGARIVAHHASQLASAPAVTWLHHEDDWRHENLGWDVVAEALVGRAVAGRCAALRIRDLTLLVLPGEADALDLVGRTREEASRWLAACFARARNDAPRALSLPPHPIPGHPVADGEPFPAIAAEALAELSRWFAAANAVLVAFAAREGRASPVRCWPHHFDLATLVTLAGRGEDARTVGLGLSPGDGGIPEPYLYVTPWPYPEPGDLPGLPAGAWNTQGWVGAVLRGAEVVAWPAAARRARAEGFLEAAFEAASTLLG